MTAAIAGSNPMRVLVAYDGSASAQAAMQATAELLPGAEAVVLTVYVGDPAPRASAAAGRPARSLTVQAGRT